MASIAMRVGRWLIYGLIDPRSDTLIYVGKTHKRRELRLAEHIERARIAPEAPVHHAIRAILDDGFSPAIFVLERVPPDASWQEAERRHIQMWRTYGVDRLPTVYPPQTRKSSPVLIAQIGLMNVRKGG